MATALIDGISTHYEVLGSGPPLLMCAPGGFDADMEKWRTQGIYAQLKFLEHLPERYSCIVFDRRDTGKSGGRVENLSWRHYAAHAKGMLDHLGIERAHIMGGCMGCSVAMAFGTAFPQASGGMVLFWPVGGAKYRINGHQRFAEHLAFVTRNGLEAVVALAQEAGKAFGKDARVGPWVSVLQTDPDFAASYAKLDVEHYKLTLARMVRILLDRDTSPGAEAEELLQLDLPSLIIPGADASHATSAARYLQECLKGSDYWNVAVAEQSQDAANARVLEFLGRTDEALGWR